MTVDEVLARIDPIIVRIARYHGRPWLPAEDLAQELRLRVAGLTEKHDARRGMDLIPFVVCKLRLYAIDLVRNQIGRDGRWMHIRAATPLSHFEIDGKLPQRVQATATEPPDTDLDFRDLVDAMLAGDEDMQILALLSCGMTRRQIGQRFGYTEAWTSNRINSDRMEHARKRSKALIGEQ